MKFSDRALDLILRHEGLNQPYKWPGGKSGITIGYGYDLGYVTEVEFVSDWKDVVEPRVIEALLPVVGKKGEEAKALSKSLKAFTVSKEAAGIVFYDKTLPKFIEVTRNIFRGFDYLPLDAQGALVSLVFNRGSAVEGRNRLEMKSIQLLVYQFLDNNCNKKLVLERIAEQIIAMNTTMREAWASVPGLFQRRKDEAQLILRSIEEVK